MRERGGMLNSGSDTYWTGGDANLSSFSEVMGGLSIFAAINKHIDTVLGGLLDSSQPLRPAWQRCLFIDGGVQREGKATVPRN